jgi:RNA 2',3'-cyclic 3'-phosphodiesterase
VARDRASRPEAKPIRMFIAADVPVPVKDHLLERMTPYRDRIPGARWTQPSSWHVTLKFLGWVWPRLESTVREAVSDVASRGGAPFEARLTSVGVFPSPARARVLWAGLADEPSDRYRDIVKLLDDALREHFEPEQREYTPHLTLARLVPPRRLDEFVPGLVGTDVSSEPFPIEELVLYRSHLSPKGATYEPLVRAVLGA